jgi:hypothetical protein
MSFCLCLFHYVFKVIQGKRSTKFMTTERKPLLGSNLYPAKHNIWEGKGDFDETRRKADFGRSRNADKQELGKRWRFAADK